MLNNPECLLARVLMGKYCHKTPFLDSIAPTSTSHGWRGICIGKKLMMTQLGKVIGNGKNTHIWSDPWISLTSPLTPMGPATESSQHLTVSELITSDTMEWDKDKIQKLFPDHLEQILELKISKLGANDGFAWLPTTSGIYSAKSGYYESLTRNPSSSLQQDLNRDFKWTTHIWNSQISPKLKFFLWKLMKGALPVGEQLRARNINQEARCPFCSGYESPIHLFFTCRFARQIWQLAPFKEPVDLDKYDSIREHLEALLNKICLPPVGIGSGPLHPWILWKIWTERNSQIFNNMHT